MPDGYGPDPLQKSMFWHEASSGPSARDLESMTAPFGGSVEQALAFMQHPAVQEHLQQMGIGGFDPSQVRQSPFFPNQFMQQHPGIGGFLNRGLANMAATPEAPLISGAGSGLSRFAQGAMGGPEMLRQYQVRQMMAPFQAAGMQLPLQAEQRRQELLGALEEDMNRRRGMEEQLQPQKAEYQRMLAEAAQQKAAAQQMQAEASMEKAGRPIQGPYGIISPGGGLQTESPAGMPAELGGQVSGQAPPPGSMQLPGGGYFSPYSPDMLQQFTGARFPGQVAGADYTRAKETAGIPGAQADEIRARTEKEKAQGEEAKAKAGAARSKGGWNKKDASGLEQKKAAVQNSVLKEYDPIRSKYANDQEWQAKDPNTYMAFMERMQQLEDQYTEAGRALGGTYPGYTYPGMKSSVPAQNPFVAPGAEQQGGPQAGGQGGQQQQFPPDAQVDEQGNVFDKSGKYLGRQQ